MSYCHINLHTSSGFYNFLLTAINGETEKNMDLLGILRSNISNRLALLPASPSQDFFFPICYCFSPASPLLQVPSLKLLLFTCAVHICQEIQELIAATWGRSHYSPHQLSSASNSSSLLFLRWFKLLVAPTGFCCWAGSWKSSTSNNKEK